MSNRFFPFLSSFSFFSSLPPGVETQITKILKDPLSGDYFLYGSSTNIPEANYLPFIARFTSSWSKIWITRLTTRESSRSIIPFDASFLPGNAELIVVGQASGSLTGLPSYTLQTSGAGFYLATSIVTLAYTIPARQGSGVMFFFGNQTNRIGFAYMSGSSTDKVFLQSFSFNSSSFSGLISVCLCRSAWCHSTRAGWRPRLALTFRWDLQAQTTTWSRASPKTLMGTSTSLGKPSICLKLQLRFGFPHFFSSFFFLPLTFLFLP